ncbi:MAG: acetyl-CoA carboxyl transferase [Marmoricola sp.]|nr:acetyl-CoA carboxyl transferase [Marmoricola sp.]
MTVHRGAREVLAVVLDAGSFASWDQPVDTSGHDPAYRAELAAAAAKAGTDESVLTGRGLVRGRPVAVVVNEFRFLGGSIGMAAARRIVAAVRRATAEGLPLLATTASGGTRMQEGTPAFWQMAEIARAVMDHRAAGLPYLVHLRHPTTGGVFASWGSLGHVTLAEPGALVGFLGPKVFEALAGRPFPEGIQRAENLLAHGVVDAVVATEDLPGVVDRVLAVLVDPPTPPVLPVRTGTAEAPPVWESVGLTRSDQRLGVRDVVGVCEATLPLAGTGEGASVLVALTRLDGRPCVLVGQDRLRQTATTPLGPAALRQAQRGMRLAEELRLPLVTVVDTPGAELSPAAEEGAVAGEIARCIAALVTLTVPTVSVVLGQGCGGGALALLPARRVLATSNAWLSPLPPEGASVIRHGDLDHAAEMAAAQGVDAASLLRAGIVHEVVPERVEDDRAELARAVVAAVAHALVDLGAA